jgi:hypothetical protein
VSAVRSETVTGALDWSEAAVLVTGGTGSFGSRFIDIMLERHWPLDDDERPAAGFRYSSEANTQWLSPAEMQELARD